MKRLFALLTACVMCISLFPVSAFAETNGPASVSGVILLEDILNNPNVTVSDVMTLDEVNAKYWTNEGVSIDSIPAAASTNDDVTYRTLSVALNVTAEYIPHLDFYCETYEGGHFFNIVSIYSVQLVRSYQHISKQFEGEIGVWLRGSTSIEYFVNGDFYNNGSTSVSGGFDVGVGLGGYGSAEFSASRTDESNHYQYFCEHRTQEYA